MFYADKELQVFESIERNKFRLMYIKTYSKVELIYNKKRLAKNKKNNYKIDHLIYKNGISIIFCSINFYFQIFLNKEKHISFLTKLSSELKAQYLIKSQFIFSFYMSQKHN